jgi:NADH dehydrogenase FAD-containing subunit
MARILVLGAGFAGLWAAIGAARKRDEIGAPATEVEILVVDRNAYHNIRVRNYEVDLSDVALPLAGLLDPIGVRHRLAEVEGIDPAKRQVAVATGGGREVLAYDRLVLTLGSELVRPAVPGLAAHGFDVDTYAARSGWRRISRRFGHRTTGRDARRWSWSAAASQASRSPPRCPTSSTERAWPAAGASFSSIRIRWSA